ncbi:MAG: hypothetical protein A2201_10335 [Alicyclobacillus sp. RIFOXYA1_FULL_53_8]|nr:MAG: hypothetical protein A2201_10335 [Alicyclobacillus sp. RIFOXYA1_FULL_53_8]
MNYGWIGSAIGLGLLALLALSLERMVARGIKRTGRRERPSPADVAIVLGAYTNGYQPGTTLTQRLKAALDLYRRGYVRYIIVSGGQGSDETVSEAKSMKRFLTFNGVPVQLILEDRHSTDTWENLRNSRQLMQQHQLYSAVVVTSDYNLPRALAVAKQLNMTVSGCAARSTPRERRFARREVWAFVKYLAVGQASLRMKGM